MPRSGARSFSIFLVLESHFKQTSIEFRRFFEKEALNLLGRGIKSPSLLALALWECQECGWRFQGRLVDKNRKLELLRGIQFAPAPIPELLPCKNRGLKYELSTVARSRSRSSH